MREPSFPSTGRMPEQLEEAGENVAAVLCAASGSKTVAAQKLLEVKSAQVIELECAPGEITRRCAPRPCGAALRAFAARAACSRADARSSLANALDRPRGCAGVQLGSRTRQVVELPAAYGGVGSSNPSYRRVRSEYSRHFVISRARRDSNSRPSGSKVVLPQNNQM